MFSKLKLYFLERKLRKGPQIGPLEAEMKKIPAPSHRSKVREAQIYQDIGNYFHDLAKLVRKK